MDPRKAAGAEELVPVGYRKLDRAVAEKSLRSIPFGRVRSIPTGWQRELSGIFSVIVPAAGAVGV